MTTLRSFFAFLVCTALTFVSCSTPQPASGGRQAGGELPEWVDNPGAHYSEARYLMAVGSGSTLNEARESALGNLSRVFQADVTTSQELYDEFRETTTRDGQFTAERTSELLNVTRIGSNQSLINTEILTSTVGPAGTYYALAGMNRSESARIYSQEIVNNSSQIEALEAEAEGAGDLLQKLLLLKRATVLAEANENLARQRNILLGGRSDRGLNTETMNRLREKLRGVQQQMPVAVTVAEGSDPMRAAIAAILQREGFSVAASGYSGRPVLEVVARFRAEEADLNRPNMKFAKWELVIDVNNNYSDRTFRSFVTEGRDGALSYPDALKRADFSAREKIETEFKTFFRRELSAKN